MDRDWSRDIGNMVEEYESEWHGNDDIEGDDDEFDPNLDDTVWDDDADDYSRVENIHWSNENECFILYGQTDQPEGQIEMSDDVTDECYYTWRDSAYRMVGRCFKCYKYGHQMRNCWANEFRDKNNKGKGRGKNKGKGSNNYGGSYVYRSNNYSRGKNNKGSGSKGKGKGKGKGKNGKGKGKGKGKNNKGKGSYREFKPRVVSDRPWENEEPTPMDISATFQSKEKVTEEKEETVSYNDIFMMSEVEVKKSDMIGMEMIERHHKFSELIDGFDHIEDGMIGLAREGRTTWLRLILLVHPDKIRNSENDKYKERAGAAFIKLKEMYETYMNEVIGRRIMVDNDGNVEYLIEERAKINIFRMKYDKGVRNDQLDSLKCMFSKYTLKEVPVEIEWSSEFGYLASVFKDKYGETRELMTFEECQFNERIWRDRVKVYREDEFADFENKIVMVEQWKNMLRCFKNSETTEIGYKKARLYDEWYRLSPEMRSKARLNQHKQTTTMEPRIQPVTSGIERIVMSTFLGNLTRDKLSKQAIIKKVKCLSSRFSQWLDTLSHFEFSLMI